MAAAPDPLLVRLDDFFAAGENTDKIRVFTETQGPAIAQMASTDSQQALEAYDLYQQYAAIVSDILERFVSAETTADGTVTAERVAAAVQAEWALPGGQARLLCTAYINAALDFEEFRNLVQEWDEIANYVDDDMIDSEEGGEQ